MTAIQIIGVDHIPEVQPGDDLVRLIATGLRESDTPLVDGDVVVVTHKIVSKAEGQLVDLTTIEPSALAVQWAEKYDKDARQIEVVLREAVRIVRMERGILIAETRHGFICANAGVDASNVSPHTVCLLPVDPDRSAARDPRRALAASSASMSASSSPTRSGGRGGTGSSTSRSASPGIPALADYRGQTDAAGYSLHVTVLAIADEIAAAAELIMNKLDARPVAIVRGYQFPVSAEPGTGRDLVMDPARDLFR